MSSNPSFANVLICTAAIGGITVLWFELTANAAKKVVQLSNEMFADKAAEERKRRREIEQEVRRKRAEEEE